MTRRNSSPANLSLDRRRFVAEANPDGDVDHETVFEFHESGDTIWAGYSGGAIRQGFLVGERQGKRIKFRYVHVTVEGELASGLSNDVIELDADGRMRLHERWECESKPGSGTSVLVEIR